MLGAYHKTTYPLFKIKIMVKGAIYLLYDGRYLSDPSRANVYEVCFSLKEAKQNKLEYGNDTVIVKCTTKCRIVTGKP